jgi:capsular polysaccharide biosynthesis protein
VNEKYQTDLGYTPEDLAEKVSMKAIADTELLEITVTVEDPNKAAAIANCIAEVLPLRVVEDLGLKPLELVDEARINPDPVSPNKMKNTVLGFAVGVMLAALVVVAFAIADGSVHDDDFVLKTYKYPTLAKIPSLSSDSSSSAKYYKEHSGASAGAKEG